MPRKVTMPGSPDILRGTDPADRTAQTDSDSGNSRGTGRVRHDDKITVYVSRAELVRLEQARLTLRAEHGLSFDRGRIVREAVAAALDDLEARGPDAELLRRLGES